MGKDRVRCSVALLKPSKCRKTWVTDDQAKKLSKLTCTFAYPLVANSQIIGRSYAESLGLPRVSCFSKGAVHLSKLAALTMKEI